MKLENIVDGMYISNGENEDCGTCTQGKRVQYSRKPDFKNLKFIDGEEQDKARIFRSLFAPPEWDS